MVKEPFAYVLYENESRGGHRPPVSHHSDTACHLSSRSLRGAVVEKDRGVANEQNKRATIGRPYETNHIPQCKITHTKRAVTDRSLICTAFKNNRKNSFNDKFNIKKNIPTFYVLHIHIHPIVKRQITAAVRLPKARQTGRNKQSLHLI